MGRCEEICARVTREQLGRAARGRAARRRRRRAVGGLVLRGGEEAQPATLHDEDARLALEVVGGLPAAGQLWTGVDRGLGSGASSTLRLTHTPSTGYTKVPFCADGTGGCER